MIVRLLLPGYAMTADEVLAELAKLGSEQTKKTFLRHGAREPFYGVKVGDLKVLQLDLCSFRCRAVGSMAG